MSKRSRYQTRIHLAENVPVAIWTTSTVTVTTNPVSAEVEPTIAERTVLAVEVEYVQEDRQVHRPLEELRLERPEHRTRKCAEQRNEPEASAEVLPNPKAPGPAHQRSVSRRHTSASVASGRARTRGSGIAQQPRVECTPPHGLG